MDTNALLDQDKEHDAAHLDALCAQVREARANRAPLAIRGGNSKAFYGRPVEGDTLDITTYRGIVRYDPVELVVTARAGTPLHELKAALAAHQQMLPCEPPSFGETATVGGMVACGLSGPRRPWAGAVRDFVLGTRVLTSEGKALHFGGEVMKNVAGFDVSRLMVGAQGTLGVLLEVSMKVLPKPRACTSLRLDMPAGTALKRLAEWGREPLPLSAACHDGTCLRLRLEGGEGSVAQSVRQLGGERDDDGYWSALNDHRLAFFDDPRPLWRLSLPANTPLLDLDGDWLLDWGGLQRWLKSEQPDEAIRSAAQAAGGHATCLTAGVSAPFAPLASAVALYHRRLKTQLDPVGIFNPGRLYAGL